MAVEAARASPPGPISHFIMLNGAGRRVDRIISYHIAGMAQVVALQYPFIRQMAFICKLSQTTNKNTGSRRLVAVSVSVQQTTTLIKTPTPPL